MDVFFAQVSQCSRNLSGPSSPCSREDLDLASALRTRRASQQGPPKSISRHTKPKSKDMPPQASLPRTIASVAHAPERGQRRWLSQLSPAQLSPTTATTATTLTRKRKRHHQRSHQRSHQQSHQRSHAVLHQQQSHQRSWRRLRVGAAAWRPLLLLVVHRLVELLGAAWSLRHRFEARPWSKIVASLRSAPLESPTSLRSAPLRGQCCLGETEPVAQDDLAQSPPVAQEPVAQEPVAQEPVAQEPAGNGDIIYL